jgi:hypothetical protein
MRPEYRRGLIVIILGLGIIICAVRIDGLEAEVKHYKVLYQASLEYATSIIKSCKKSCYNP